MRVLEFEGENPKYRILRDTAQPVVDGVGGIVCYSYQIEACRDFGDVKEDDKGGRVTGFHNLSHEGLCWVEEGSSVVEGASVRDNAHIGLIPILAVSYRCPRKLLSAVPKISLVS